MNINVTPATFDPRPLPKRTTMGNCLQAHANSLAALARYCIAIGEERRPITPRDMELLAAQLRHAAELADKVSMLAEG